MGGLLQMSEKELDRYVILQKVLAKELTQKSAGELLNISNRQVRNLISSLRSKGPSGLISKHRGKVGNHRKSNEFKQSVLAIVSERYEGYGPTFTKEKLEEWHNLKLSRETLRLWMIEQGLWQCRKKKKKVHLPRERRPCFGEMTQGDGSRHYWFGDDLPAANATVLVDDATSTVTSLVFSEQETLDSYFAALRQHIEKYGRPRALYTDRYAVFQAAGGKGTTQMQRALKELDIELILANSPQAKGRVERANRTLQDRLVKELSLRGIKTIEQANAYAKEFVESYNKKFSKKPMKDFDAHRPLKGYDLDKVLCRCEMRTLLSDLSFQRNNKFYIVQGISDVRRAKSRKIEIREAADGKIRVFLAGKELQVGLLKEAKEEVALVLSRKEVIRWKPKGCIAIPDSHPWKSYNHQRLLRERKKEMKMYNEEG